MHLEPYQSSNGHTVTMYGRLMFLVSSASRSQVIHIVDIEEHTVCSCEAFFYNATRPCRHIDACLEAIAYWANIPEHNRTEWRERLHFLLEMGVLFIQALVSPSLMSLRTDVERLAAKTHKRKYTLKNEAPKTNPRKRMHPGVRRKSDRLPNRQGT
jgi:hypothetical protein